MLNRLSLAFGRKPKGGKNEFKGLLDSDSDEDDDDFDIEADAAPGATVLQTSVNVAKMCMGTGTLALPFAAQKGGLIFNVVGLFLIGMWNYYSTNCLLRCLEYAPQIENEGEDEVMRGSFSVRMLEDTRESYSRGSIARMSGKYGSLARTKSGRRIGSRPPPPDGTTTYGAVAWYAAGRKGLVLLDTLMILLFFGIVVAYEVAMASFIADMPFTTGSSKVDLLIPSTIVAALSCAKDMSFLSNFSGMGLIAVGVSFLVISLQGIWENGITGFQNSLELNLWPETFGDACSWFGVVVFGYGVVPFVFNIRNSMSNPDDITLAVEIGLFIVVLGYIIISNGIRVLFSPSHTFTGDVLQAMPDTWISLVVRFLMTFVISVTAPLIIVPFGELLEGKLGVGGGEQHHKAVMVRLTICVVCTGLSLLLGDGFVNVVSFIGCFCMSMVGFVLPTLFCVQLSTEKLRKLDAAMLVVGIIATAYTSTLTFKAMIAGAG